MKTFLYFIVLSIFLVLGITFTLQNPQSISIKYYLGVNWHGPLIVLVLVSIAVGILFGFLFGSAKRIRLRTANSRLKKQNQLLVSRESSTKSKM